MTADNPWPKTNQQRITTMATAGLSVRAIAIQLGMLDSDVHPIFSRVMAAKRARKATAEAAKLDRDRAKRLTRYEKARRDYEAIS